MRYIRKHTLSPRVSILTIDTNRKTDDYPDLTLFLIVAMLVMLKIFEQKINFSSCVIRF